MGLGFTLCFGMVLLGLEGVGDGLFMRKKAADSEHVMVLAALGTGFGVYQHLKSDWSFSSLEFLVMILTR